MVPQLTSFAGQIELPWLFSLTWHRVCSWQVAAVVELTEEQKEHMAKVAADKAESAGAADAKAPTSFFHGKADKDYQGAHTM